MYVVIVCTYDSVVLSVTMYATLAYAIPYENRAELHTYFMPFIPRPF